MTDEAVEYVRCVVCNGFGRIAGTNDTAPRMNVPDPDYWTKCRICDGTGKVKREPDGD